MRKHRTITITACVLLVFAIIWGFYQRNRQQQYIRYLSSMYDRSFYELIDSMDNIEVKLEKLLVADNSSAGGELIADIWRQSYSVSENLSVMPSNTQNSQEVMAFVNKLGEYCRSLSIKDSLNDKDRETIGELISACRMLNDDIEAVRLAGDEIFVSKDNSDTAFLDNIGTNGIDYPTLIYDGPFSDAARGEAKGLPTEEVDVETAQLSALKLIGTNAVNITSLDNIEGEIPCYCLRIETENGNAFTAAVTKKGGKVLWLLSDELPENTNLQLSDAVESAAQVLSGNGFSNMHMTHWQVSKASVLMTFVALDDDVILYPDMVKLIISLEDGSVLGMDAGNYYRNHTQREHFDQIITSEEAEESVSRDAQIKSSQLCLIPYNDREIFCHELTLVYDDSVYYKYIDAQTGDVVEVLKLVNTEFGNMVI
ncbi:MAG: hypothetical protein E7334_06430 [Clostridiales bacterium]|nr:hypothetical protein [Clostridiales bacterium]